MKRAVAIVATAIVVACAGTWFGYTQNVDPTWVCERRAIEEYEQLEALTAPLAEKQIGETSRDLECWGKEPKASIGVRLPLPEVSPRDAIALLGDDWKVDGTEAVTVDGTWRAISYRTSDEGKKWDTKVLFFRA